jgi:hypothetical protein
MESALTSMTPELLGGALAGFGACLISVVGG